MTSTAPGRAPVTGTFRTGAYTLVPSGGEQRHVGKVRKSHVAADRLGGVIHEVECD